MNVQTALLDIRRMGEAGRLSLATGTPATKLTKNAGNVSQQPTSAQLRIGRLHRVSSQQALEDVPCPANGFFIKDIYGLGRVSIYEHHN